MAAPLSEEQWRRLEPLFQQAVELPVEDRGAFIEAATAGEPELRRELLEMLAHDGDASARIAGSISGVAQLAAMGGAWEGRRIGSYRLVREIGRGGMGIVFEAVRADAEYRKTVALKILPAWRDEGGLRERFRIERQILSGLEHPNIARFLEGGTEEGVPYFVMEYVDGVSLAEWRQRNPGLDEVLDLFRQICAAVHYAHENLIVHRDLKPANILVNREGVPKLLDFGIAKLLAPLPGDGGGTTELRRWTPDYASPEQVRGGAITTRTDVYSLGLILYELLCGERAQQADPSSPLALDRSVCELEPPLPSARAEGARARQLRGDLDIIVAKAISKDPQRRYSSAAALNADLERHRGGLTVTARPATLLYQAGKLVRRHRFVFAAGALVAATAIAGVVATVHQARRAERRFEQVRSLATAFVFDVHDRIQYLPGATAARKVIVATGLRYLESLREDAGSDASLALELGQAYLRIGDVQGNPLYSSLHDTKGALASYGAARGLLTPLARNHARAQLDLAQVEDRFGLIESFRGDGQASGASYQRAKGMVNGYLAGHPDDVEALMLASDISAQIARDAIEQHLPEVARSEAQATVDIAKRLAAVKPDSIEALDYLASAQSTLGSAYRAAEQLEESARWFRESAATREQLVGKQRQNSGYSRELMIAYGHVGDDLGPVRSYGLGDLDGALQAYRKAMEIAETMVRQDPADRTARSDLANAQFRVAETLFAEPSREREALALFQASERNLADLLKQDSKDERSRYLMMFARRRMGETLERLGRSEEAARELSLARDLAQSFNGTRNAAGGRAGFVMATIDLARIKARSGDPAARVLADRAAQDLPSAPLRSAGWVWGEALTYASMGRVFLQLGRRRDAAFWLRKSLGDWQQMKLTGNMEAQRAAQLKSVESSLGKAQ